MVVGEGRLKDPFPVPVVAIADGAVPVSAPLILKEMVAFHWAYKVMSPLVDFQFAVLAPKLVPSPLANVFQPPNVYPVRASAVALSSVIVDESERTNTAEATVDVSLVFPFPL